MMGWRDVEYSAVPIADPRVDAVIEELRRSHVNGGVILQAFRPADLSQYQAAERSDRQGWDHWLRCFLEAASVRTSLPDLAIPERFDDLPPHTMYGGYEFEGAITSTLIYGGAYHRRPEDDAEARRLSRAFADAICGPDRNVLIFRIDGAWTGWFFDIAWDQTFVVWQWAPASVVLISITDTD